VGVVERSGQRLTAIRRPDTDRHLHIRLGVRIISVVKIHTVDYERM